MENPVTASDEQKKLVLLNSELVDKDALENVAAPQAADLLIEILREPNRINNEIDLGPAEAVPNLQSSVGEVNRFTSHQIEYPKVVVEALKNLYIEFNHSFTPLVAANRETAEDYKEIIGTNDLPRNLIVQVDMTGLTPEFFRAATHASEPEVRSALRRGIFEIENSIAMYQLLEKSFSTESAPSSFGQKYRSVLEDLRKATGRPIALLALTAEKLEGMRAMEFGKAVGEGLSDEEVRTLSGFDTLMGSDDLKKHLSLNNGKCEYLLYVRASDPVAKLKNPALKVPSDLLADPSIRAAIRANSITLNIDDPEASAEKRINDTKAYMPAMGMAFRVSGVDSLIDKERVERIVSKVGRSALSSEMLNSDFISYLEELGIEPAEVTSGKIAFRAKPLQGTYGCYGHVRGCLNQSEFRGELARGIRKRGDYLVQPEIPTPIVTNLYDDVSYTYIDRNFLALTSRGIEFLGGFRSMIPADTTEAKNGRVHGSKETVYVEIREAKI